MMRNEREIEMTKFVNENFQFDGMYLNYVGPFEGQKTYDEVYGADKIHPSRIGMKKEAFIARFKHGGMVAFKKFLRDNFTVEEYLDLLDSGLAPVQALETKGYVSPAVAKNLKKHGYPMTLEGRKQFIDDQLSKGAI
jgi:hypothetical protein